MIVGSRTLGRLVSKAWLLPAIPRPLGLRSRRSYEPRNRRWRLPTCPRLRARRMGPNRRPAVRSWTIRCRCPHGRFDVQHLVHPRQFTGGQSKPSSHSGPVDQVLVTDCSDAQICPTVRTPGPPIPAADAAVAGIANFAVDEGFETRFVTHPFQSTPPAGRQAGLQGATLKITEREPIIAEHDVPWGAGDGPGSELVPAICQPLLPL